MRRIHQSRALRASALAGIATLAIIGGTTLAGMAAGAPVRTPSITEDRGYVDLVAAVMPAVVNVRVTSEAAESGLSLGARPSPEMRDFFERFFGKPYSPHGDRRGNGLEPPQLRGEGSGFFIDDRGHVVTNAHVVGRSSAIEIVTQDGETHKASLVGLDEKTDLALLKIETTEPTPYVELAVSADVRVGQPVLAVGNPFGLGGTVTSGIVSATGRELGAGPFDDFLQIDASINRGNSGGPTFDLDGKVVGVNTMIFSPNGGSVGIGFAIASDVVARVVEDLLDDGRIDRGWLGVTIQSLDADLATALELGEPEGALVAEIAEGSPAEDAGLAPGDVLTAVDGQPITTLRDATRAIAAISPGSEVRVDVLRAGAPETFEVVLATAPTDDLTAVQVGDGEKAEPKIGLHLAELDAADKARLAIDNGVRVAAVEPGSPASTKGIQAGDIILAVGGQTVGKAQDVVALVKSGMTAGDRALLLELLRDGRRMFVAIPLAIS